MKVSIITSVYNCEYFVKEMIDSIIDQTYGEWEMILIDDASYDGTWDIINGIEDERIIKIRNPINVGLTKNLNRALELASGKYILRMDADDIAVKNRIEKQVKFMEKNLDVVLSGGWMQCFGKMHNIIKTHLNDEDIRIDMIFDSAIMHPTFIVRNEILKKYHIKYNEDLRYAQDYDFAYEISKYGKLANIPESLLKYRIHNDQISSAQKEQQKECADLTRKKIIKNMGISVSNDEFDTWSNFCVGKVRGTDEEKRIINEIIESIRNKNQLNPNYDSKKLNRTLSKKVQALLVTNEEKTEELEKYKRLFLMMSRWMILKQNGDGLLVEWLMARYYQNIAIYGIGNVGECLANELKNTPIKVVYGIDKDSGIICSLKKVVSPDDKLEKVDAIIITAIFYSSEIRKILVEKVNCPVISIEDIVYDIEF